MRCAQASNRARIWRKTIQERAYTSPIWFIPTKASFRPTRVTEPDMRGANNSTGAMALVKRALREPLVHFLGIGLALFLGYSLVRGPDEGPSGDAIAISEGRVSQIAESFLLLSGRLPSRPELESLVDDFISEEVAYREAVAMGLDADDTIVRRRMRQKLEFLIEDGDANEEPTEADLQQWLDANADLYRVPERRAIRQVMASADRRGASAKADAGAFVASLKSGADASSLGDPSMLPAALPLTTYAGVSSLFGDRIRCRGLCLSGRGLVRPREFSVWASMLSR